MIVNSRYAQPLGVIQGLCSLPLSHSPGGIGGLSWLHEVRTPFLPPLSKCSPSAQCSREDCHLCSLSPHSPLGFLCLSLLVAHFRSSKVPFSGKAGPDKVSLLPDVNKCGEGYTDRDPLLSPSAPLWDGGKSPEAFREEEETLHLPDRGQDVRLVPRQPAPRGSASRSLGSCSWWHGSVWAGEPGFWPRGLIWAQPY